MWKIYKKLKGKIAIALCSSLVLALCSPFEAQALTIDSSKLRIYSCTNSVLLEYDERDGIPYLRYLSVRSNMHTETPHFYDDSDLPSYGYNWVQTSPGSASILYNPVMSLYCDFNDMVFLSGHQYSVTIDFYYADGAPFSGSVPLYFAVYPHAIEDLFPVTGYLQGPYREDSVVAIYPYPLFLDPNIGYKGVSIFRSSLSTLIENSRGSWAGSGTCWPALPSSRASRPSGRPARSSPGKTTRWSGPGPIAAGGRGC